MNIELRWMTSGDAATIAGRQLPVRRRRPARLGREVPPPGQPPPVHRLRRRRAGRVRERCRDHAPRQGHRDAALRARRRRRLPAPRDRSLAGGRAARLRPGARMHGHVGADRRRQRAGDRDVPLDGPRRGCADAHPVVGPDDRRGVTIVTASVTAPGHARPVSSTAEPATIRPQSEGEIVMLVLVATKDPDGALPSDRHFAVEGELVVPGRARVPRLALRRLCRGPGSGSSATPAPRRRWSPTGPASPRPSCAGAIHDWLDHQGTVDLIVQAAEDGDYEVDGLPITDPVTAVADLVDAHVEMIRDDLRRASRSARSSAAWARSSRTRPAQGAPRTAA